MRFSDKNIRICQNAKINLKLNNLIYTGILLQFCKIEYIFIYSRASLQNQNIILNFWESQ